MSDQGAEHRSGFTDQGRRVADHWSRLAVSYEGAIRSLAGRGIRADAATVEDLHDVDMIHMGGVAATDALASLAGVAAGHRVLDVGCGVGGPARRLASRFGARVWGVELSEVLCEAASKLTELVGLAQQVRFAHGSGLALPFPDTEFDVVIMQHVAMQVSEKDQLFTELARVVRPGGGLALHELFAGEGDLHYPLPWATEPSMSALEPLADCVERVSRAGFDVGTFRDQSDDGRRFHEAQIAAYDAALSQHHGVRGLTEDVVEARRRASVAMVKNLSSGALKVGMLVGRKRH